MKIEDLKFQELNGKKFVILKDKVTKNHRESDGSVSSEARIYEHCDKSLCMYTLLKQYISCLNETLLFLWQRPKNVFLNEGKSYFNSRVGKNTLYCFMSQISSKYELSQQYTNHSIRSTSIMVLAEAGFQDTDIVSISGHKSLTALGSYKRPSDKLLEQISNHLLKPSGQINVKCDLLENDYKETVVDQNVNFMTNCSSSTSNEKVIPSLNSCIFNNCSINFNYGSK